MARLMKSFGLNEKIVGKYPAQWITEVVPLIATVFLGTFIVFLLRGVMPIHRLVIMISLWGCVIPAILRLLENGCAGSRRRRSYFQYWKWTALPFGLVCAGTVFFYGLL